MIWRVWLIIVLCLAISPLALAQEMKSDPLTDTQAADMMSDLLTYYGDLANRRIDAMNAFIADIGKHDDYEINRPVAPKRKEMTFAEAFKGTIMFMQNGGAKLADPALAKMTPDQLAKELDALQHYNIQQFLFLNTQRDEIARMKAYLDSIGQFDAYLEWAKTHAPRTTNLLSAAPTTQNAQAFANWLKAEMDVVKARTWKKAQAQGMTEDQFNQEWAKRKEAMQQDLSNRIEAVKTVGAYFAPRPAQPPVAAPGTDGKSWAGQGAVSIPALPGTPGADAGGNGAPTQSATPTAFQATPLTANDPRWQAGYYGPNSSFNGWNDAYSDVFTPNGGGGVTARYDTRVNNDYDVRVNGEIDRRANTSFDRRQNIQIDPRVNY